MSKEFKLATMKLKPDCLGDSAAGQRRTRESQGNYWFDGRGQPINSSIRKLKSAREYW